ncbi:hypothetical protein KUCAC02_012857 [Chaenocephalus aceratus]|uniref:Uncharacterized protein n=1 Tax=Chaenocephalus aceratus TaxID=36190 RepID=A0ACB9XDX6_CHAAC|nr:hypothetical protein KUCAC02_012857 [Chaenocephalus aceratus]
MDLCLPEVNLVVELTPRSDTPLRDEGTAVLLLVVGLCVLDATSSLKSCAFNVQSFGESKANNRKVMGILLKILLRYDKSNTYSYVESERLGRKSYKEQYVYLYRTNVLTVQEHYQYPKLEGDGTNETDVSPESLSLFAFTPQQHHTCPKNAMKEINELHTVFKWIYQKWKTENVMILGDLNAACSYVTIKGWEGQPLEE